MSSTASNSKILVIDDNPTNLEVLCGALDGQGYELLVEMDGHGGIEQAQTNKPDLILLDVMMPGINGFETCQILKENPTTREIPVIFMTALTETENKVRGLKLGAVDYITKPFQQEEVIARIQVHLQLHQVTQELAAQKAQLEERVQVRTADLTQALEELKAAHLSIVQSEKMSSLGQLVAGIAHEINNPVNFINGNMAHLEGYAEGALKLLELYRTRYPNGDAEIEELAEDIELDFLQEDFPKVMSSMRLGIQRISEIVTGLRNFSRHDEAEMKPVNIHEGIDSTLLILQHRFKPHPDRPKIEIIQDYGKLPNVECYAGALNQVIMNLVGNAIDSIEEINQPGQIMIQTCPVQETHIQIRIKDTGTGIKDEIRDKIFDPFFTTKPIGKGTGLGLSISYKIVTEKHGGTLTCSSQVGEGTEFLIEIPVHQSSHAESCSPNSLRDSLREAFTS